MPTIQIGDEGVNRWRLRRLKTDAGDGAFLTLGYELTVWLSKDARLIRGLGRMAASDEPIAVGIAMQRARATVRGMWTIDEIERGLNDCVLTLSTAMIESLADEPEQTEEGP